MKLKNIPIRLFMFLNNVKKMEAWKHELVYLSSVPASSEKYAAPLDFLQLHPLPSVTRDHGKS